MNAEVFKHPSSFNDVVDFFKSKGFKEVPYSDQPEYLEGKTYCHLEADDQGTTITVALFESEPQIKDFEKELKNLFVDYMILVRSDLREYALYKLGDKIEKLTKRTEELELAFLSKLDQVSFNNLESLEKLFDRSEFIREFYDLYCYSEEYLVRNILGIPDTTLRDLYGKTLMNRLIFLWFLQKKGFLDSDPRYLIRKFELITKQRKNYYRDYLRTLFFEGLCQQPSERSNDTSMLLGDIPYLNGGLFLETEIESRYGNSITIPNEAFYRRMSYPISKGERNLPVLNLLECKDWTVDERGREVDKLNPEILGHIFEKSINKREIGAYYTPEKITKYISEQTIFPFLVDSVNDEFGTDYLTWAEILENPQSPTHLKHFQQVLEGIRVLDPAVGSGHFLVDAITTLEGIYRKLRERGLLELDDFDIRRKIITNNIYGVDILEGAIEVCKLRLFLFLAETLQLKEEIKPLPNIDFNIRVGNSLIGYCEPRQTVKLLKGRRLKEIYVSLIDRYQSLDDYLEDSIKAMFNQRNKLIRKFRFSRGKEALQLRREIEQITEGFNIVLDRKLHADIRGVFLIAKRNGVKEVAFSDVESLKPFHWVMEFSDVFQSGGFDVIIGNPPYGTKVLSSAEKNLYKRIYKTTATDRRGKGSTNIAALFLERTLSLLKADSHLGMIVPQTITRLEDFEKLRNYLLDNYCLYHIVDEGNPFKDSEVELEMISLFCKKRKKESYVIAGYSRKQVGKREYPAPSVTYKRYGGRFLIYWDEVFETLCKGAEFKKFKVSQGIPRRSDYTPQGTILCLGAAAIDPYVIKKKDIDESRKVTLEFVRNNRLTDQIQGGLLVTAYSIGKTGKVTDLSFECVLTPKGFLPDGTAVVIKPTDKRLAPKYLLGLLNSTLVNYVTCKYLFNFGVRMFRNYTFEILPMKVPENQHSFVMLVDYILMLKDLIHNAGMTELEGLSGFYHGLLDCLIYELYLEQDIGTKLRDSLANYLNEVGTQAQVSRLAETAELIKNDGVLMESLAAIKGHPIVRVIEQGSGKGRQ